jgi:hypothetical protein
MGEKGDVLMRGGFEGKSIISLEGSQFARPSDKCRVNLKILE